MWRKYCKKITALVLAGAFFLIGWGVGSLPRILARGENPYGWEKMSSYTTYFNEKEWGRCENIRIAASLLDGITVQGYGEFSFNKAVGKRTEEAGFKEAKIIVNGEYAQGVGGGVCQVSTTLYNAALKSGLMVTELHPHSLKVSYVQPSRDAMVSDTSDFCFFNPYPFPVRLTMRFFSGGICAEFSGIGDGKRRELVSRTLGEIPPPEPIVKPREEGEEEGYLRFPQKGIKSELYLEEYAGKVLLSRKLLRRDEYRPIRGIIIKKNDKATNKIPSNDCVFFEKLL